MELKEVINIIQYYEEAWLEGKATIEKENKAQEAIQQVTQWNNINERLMNRIQRLEKDIEFYEKDVNPYSYAHYKSTYEELAELKRLYKADTNI